MKTRDKQKEASGQMQVFTVLPRKVERPNGKTEVVHGLHPDKPREIMSRDGRAYTFDGKTIRRATGSGLRLSKKERRRLRRKVGTLAS